MQTVLLGLRNTVDFWALSRQPPSIMARMHRTSLAQFGTLLIKVDPFSPRRLPRVAWLLTSPLQR